jgi:hypothetical protein
MKKLKGIRSVAVMAILSGAMLLGYGDQARADINGSEASVIGAASSTFYYQGEYYRVKSTYINQLVNALNTQYDLTPSQASACVDYIYNNVAAGISSGYLYKVEVDSQYSYDGTVDEFESSDDGTPDVYYDPDSDEDANQTTEESYQVAENIVTVDETAPKKSKEDLIKETTDLAENMGLSISYDQDKGGVTLTDKSGNVLVSMKNAVKNTGYRLNSLIVFVAAMGVVFILTIFAAIRYGLFHSEEPEEEYED